MIRHCLAQGTRGPVSVRLIAAAACATSLAIGVSPSSADPTQDWTRTETRADCTSYNALRNPYFGDTHVHTRYSADAVLARTRNTPYDAYDFAQGGTVGLPPFDGLTPLRTATIDRPLDFTAITDHAEGFGEAVICLEGDDLMYDGFNDPICENLRETFDNTYHPSNPLPQAFVDFFIALNGEDPLRFAGICGAAPDYADCAAQAGVVWQDMQDAAEANYDRTAACSFTSFIAYEWSGNTDGNNLHRNVIFRNTDVPPLPITYYEEWKAEGLWAELKSQCIDAANNCDVLAIPHNSNIATNAMFSPNDTDGNPLTAEQAATRAFFEPIMELTQIKGDSECRNGVTGTDDEQCSFEKLSRQQLLTASDWDQSFSPFAYARGALKLGIRLESGNDAIGVNPFQLGFVGATDTHNGTPGAVSEIDYGKIGFSGVADSEPNFILAESTAPSKVQANGGGLSVVWAEENSRDALFAGMRRRETYSTSGPRILVRSFAGDYPDDLCDDASFVAKGYDNGVPMGGEIGPVRGKKSPSFAIMAQKDSGGLGTQLQRIQVVKGWLEADGSTSEEVFDVAGDAKNGADVNTSTCQTTGPGSDTLCTVWEDKKFKPGQDAFYYVRVLENPTCRWSQELCRNLKTCSTTLLACSGDKTRTCTVDTDCSDFGSGVCNVTYPVICTSNGDCERAGAGTCGSTPAVPDCTNPASLPPGATECCDERIPQKIQERAVASPIWYHANLLGVSKAGIKFGKTTGDDDLKMQLVIGKSPADLDPATKDLTLSVSDDAPIFTATIPAGTMEVKKPGSSYSYKDKAGTIAGITQLKIKISKGVAKITLKAGGIDLAAGVTKAAQKLTTRLVSGTYDSTSVNNWSYKDPKMYVKY